VNVRLLLIVAAACAVLGSFMVFSFEYANHAPTPHGVPIALVAPSQEAVRLRAALDEVVPGGFSIARASSPTAARRAVITQQADGALIIASSGRAHILTAAAQGLNLQRVVLGTLSAAAAAAHRPVIVTDVAPVSSGDRSGQSGFVYSLGLLIPSVIGGMLLYQLGRGARLWWLVAAGIVYALLVAFFGMLILDFGFGALTGHFAALFAIGTFGALAAVLFSLGCQATIGVAGAGVSALVFLFIGGAVNGGTTAAAMLPVVYRQISPWTPNGAIVRAVRSVTYFHGHGIGQPIVALAALAALALLLIAGNDLLQVTARRASPADVSSIYGTSGIRLVTEMRRRPGQARPAPVTQS
jgi:hypothetical protein